jgi:hypothetical protein
MGPTTSTDPTKDTITVLCEMMASSVIEIGRLRAENWALVQALESGLPEVYGIYRQRRSDPNSLGIQDAASYQVARIHGVLSKLS